MLKQLAWRKHLAIEVENYVSVLTKVLQLCFLPLSILYLLWRLIENRSYRLRWFSKCTVGYATTSVNFLKSLYETDSDHREQHRGGGGISRRHLGWVLWLGTWAQFSHQKRLHPAWSYKSLFIQLGNKYTLTMGCARAVRIGKSTMTFSICVG